MEMRIDMAMQNRNTTGKCSNDMQHGNAAYACSMYMLHGHAAWKNRRMKLVHSALTCTLDMQQ
jgi:hypothetical protein